MNIENIHLGDHIVIVGRHSEHGFDRTEQCGWPAKVVGICPPYLAIEAVGHGELSGVKTIDTRIWELTKADRRYVYAFKGPASQPKAEVYSKVPLCPICKQGVFKHLESSSDGPHWRCDYCRAVVVEEAMQS